MSKNRRSVGRTYENIAAAYLRRKGMVILEQNYRCRLGEIDLIARDDRCFVFVEVKYRRTSSSGFATAAVDRKKQQIIGRVASFYLMSHTSQMDVPCRFDVVAIDDRRIQWIPNAFMI